MVRRPAIDSDRVPAMGRPGPNARNATRLFWEVAKEG
jgi:hypothetical protein